MNADRPGIGRIAAGAVAVAAMLPYLTLKTLWLTGTPLGVNDPALMDDPSMEGLNAMTFGMDAVGLVLALAFTMRWGMRLPAWLVLLPIWVGTGLLSVVAAVAPVLATLTGGSAFEGGPIQPWVYMMVYGGFLGQACGLIAGFVLYARDRWPAVFVTRLDHPFPSPTRPFQTVVAWGSLVVVAPIAAVRFAWAVQGTGGPAAVLQDALKGLLALGAAVALVALVRRRGHGPFARPLALAWLGSGCLFGWGLYAMILRSVGGPLGGSAAAGLPDLIELFGMLTGLVMGMCGAFLLAERSGVRDVEPVQQPLERVQGEADRRTADHGHR